MIDPDLCPSQLLSADELRDLKRRRRELSCSDRKCGGCPSCLEAQGVSEDDNPEH